MVLQAKKKVEQPHPMFRCYPKSHFEGGRKSTKRFIYDKRPVDPISNEDLKNARQKFSQLNQSFDS